MKNILLFACLFPATLFAQVQQDSTDEDSAGNGKCIKVISVSGFMGGDFYRDGFEDRTVFQQAAPSSTLAFANLAGYTNSFGYFMMTTGNMSNGMNVNLRLRCMPKFSEFTVGIKHTNLNIASQYYSRQTTTQLDTTQLPGGEVLFTDSVHNSAYHYNWNSDVITLNIAWIVHTNTRRLMNLYTGIGFSGGIGFNGIYTAEYQDYSYLQYHSEGPSYINYTSSFEYHADERENMRAPVFGSYGVYIPVGFNLRLSKRQNFLGHLALFGEYQGQLQFILPNGVDTKIRTVSSMNGGLRWYVNAPKYLDEGHRRGHRHHRDRSSNGSYDRTQENPQNR